LRIRDVDRLARFSGVSAANLSGDPVSFAEHGVLITSWPLELKVSRGVAALRADQRSMKRSSRLPEVRPDRRGFLRLTRLLPDREQGPVVVECVPGEVEQVGQTAGGRWREQMFGEQAADLAVAVAKRVAEAVRTH
jgi:hypothetical protein